MSLPAEAPAAPTLVVREDDGVPVLEIPEALSLEALRDWLDDALPAQLDAIAGRAGRLDLGDRAIQLFDLRRLVHHLDQTHGVSITGLYARSAAIHRFAERELKLKLFPLDGEAPPEEPPELDEIAVEEIPVELDPDSLEEAEKIDPPEEDEDEDEAVDEQPEAVAPTADKADPGRRTLHVHRTVRSGNAVRFDGDITIFGDVNPGAQVTASGSIVVLGTLKGVAHAGATGDEEAFILGLSLLPTQLRIGRRIAIASEEGEGGPEIAVVRDGRIVIEPYRSKIPRRGT